MMSEEHVTGMLRKDPNMRWIMRIQSWDPGVLCCCQPSFPRSFLPTPRALDGCCRLMTESLQLNTWQKWAWGLNQYACKLKVPIKSPFTVSVTLQPQIFYNSLSISLQLRLLPEWVMWPCHVKSSPQQEASVHRGPEGMKVEGRQTFPSCRGPPGGSTNTVWGSTA